MSYIVVTRNPSNGRLIVMLEGEDDRVAEFANASAANYAARSAIAFEAWGYEIVEVEL